MSLAALTAATNELTALRNALLPLAQIRAQLQAEFAARQSGMVAETWLSSTGNDAAAGTAAAPLATLAACLARAPHGGVAIVNLATDYALPGIVYVSNRTLFLRSAQGGPRRTLTGAPRASGSASDYGLLYLDRSALFIVDVTLSLPPGGQAGFYQSLIEAGKGSAASAPMPCVALELCNIVAQANSPPLVHPGFGVHLAVSGVTWNLAPAGRWVDGAAAGTATASLPFIISNLATL